MALSKKYTKKKVSPKLKRYKRKPKGLQVEVEIEMTRVRKSPKRKTTSFTKKQEDKVGRVMEEYKEGKLKSGSKKGPRVVKRKQAIAIALSEARAMKKKKKGKKK